MSHKAAKLGATGLIVGLAFSGLLYTSLGESAEYYKHVEEVLANPQEWHGKRLQLHGFAKNVGWKPGTLEYRFDVESKGHVIKATYTGSVPDTFKEDSEVVLKGMLATDGTFHVAEDGVMAKCPSKYEAAPKIDGAAPPASPGTE
jgi:cytochrome c-type biogenesis protein CcmE